MQSKPSEMEYRYLGNSGLKVSLIGFGNMSLYDLKKEDEYLPIYKRCIELGINFFDTAEAYGGGAICEPTSEIIMGNIFKKLKVPREELVISTKVFFGKAFDFNAPPNYFGLSRKHIIEGANNCLKRL